MARIQRFLVLGLVALALAACGAGSTPVEGNQAPDFTLKAVYGDIVKLSDFQGHPVLINFWATWCPPCMLEMPLIQDRYEKYAPDLVVLAVNYDETESLVKAFVLDKQITFNVLLDPGGIVQNLYMVRGYPTSVFVDAEGVIQKIHIGILTEAQLDENLSLIGLNQRAEK
jgi:peroxiredoxin